MIVAATNWGGLVVLVPAVVIGGGIALGVMILLVRAFGQFVRESGHKRLIIAFGVLVVIAVVVMTYLGINLPVTE